MTTARLAELTDQLSPRDMAVIRTLPTLGVASGDQLEQLHFAMVTSRHRRRALERLHSAGVLARLDRRIGGTRAGSAGFVYALDIAGQRLAETMGAFGPRRSPRRPETPSLATLSHRLAVTELYAQLVELGRHDVCELICFQAEPDCWRGHLGSYGEAVTLKPDAFVILHTTAYEFRYFVEVDLATESMTTVARKAEAYRRYWASGREQADHGVFPLVLFLVPEQPRRSQIQYTLDRQPPDSRRLYQTALLSQASEIFRVGART